MTITRYHIEFAEDPGSFCAHSIAESVNGSVVSTTQKFNGVHDLAIIEIEDTPEVVEYLEEMLEANENVVSYRSYGQAPSGAGRPITLPGPIGNLARKMCGVQVLCDRLGGVAPSTVRRWANGEIQPQGPARLLLDQLLAEHRIPDLALVEHGGEVRVEDLRNRRCSIWLDYSERDQPLEDFELDEEIPEDTPPGKILRRW